MAARAGIWTCAVAAALSAPACGPTASSLDARDSNVALRVVSGDTGRPVESASVVIDGRSTVTDSGGVTVVAHTGEARIESAAFLPRRTATLSGDISLWPRDDQYPEAYVRALLYQRAYQTRETALGPDGRLRRVVAPVVTVVPDPPLWADNGVRAAHEQAAAEITAATGGRVTFVVAAAGGTLPSVRAHIDTALPPGDALAYRDLRGDTIVGGRVAFGSPDVARSARFVAHELGHVLGLEHSIVPTDVMYFAVDRGRGPSFSANERRTIRLLMQRPPGNRFPDTDATVSSSSAAPASETLRAEALPRLRRPGRASLTAMAWLMSLHGVE